MPSLPNRIKSRLDQLDRHNNSDIFIDLPDNRMKTHGPMPGAIEMFDNQAVSPSNESNNNDMVRMQSTFVPTYKNSGNFFMFQNNAKKPSLGTGIIGSAIMTPKEMLELKQPSVKNTTKLASLAPPPLRVSN